MRDQTRATGDRFGFGWSVGGLPGPLTAPVDYHLHAMRTALGAPPFRGRILDAGCGDGVDLASLALEGGCLAIGVELSDGGVRASAARIAGSTRALLAQGDVLALPFRDRSFEGAYSYGVVHHTLDPQGAVREIARTLKTGGSLLLYVYEDFELRSPPWRIALSVVNAIRGRISMLNPENIRRFCALIAPAVYLSCTLPSKHFRWAARFPYPAAQNPTLRSLIPDLYDRFAAPIEARYSERGARALLERAGCRVKAVVNRRGWMLWGEKLECVTSSLGR